MALRLRTGLAAALRGGRADERLDPTAWRLRAVEAPPAAPPVALADPGPYLRDRVKISAWAAADEAVEELELEVAPAGSGDWSAAARAADPAELVLDTRALADGAYDVRVAARAGGEAIGASDPVRVRVVDNTPPDAVLLHPRLAQTVTGVVPLEAAATDGGSGIALVAFQFSHDDGAWRPIPKDDALADSARWDTSTLPPGDYRLRVLAIDRARNAATSDTVAVTVESSTVPQPPVPPDPEPPTPMPPQPVPDPTPPTPEPAPPFPDPTPEPPGPVAAVAEPGVVRLWDLERLVAARPAADSFVQAEREALVYHLRSFAAADGSIPPQFDSMIWDALGELLEAR